MDWRQRRDNTNVGLLLELATELGVELRSGGLAYRLQDQPLEQVVRPGAVAGTAVIPQPVAQYP